MAAHALKVTVVTPEGKALESEAVSVVFPAYDGLYGILPGHAPLLTEMGVGPMRMTAPGGERRELYVDGGFAQMSGDRLTLLTEHSAPIESLTTEHAASLLAQAREMTVTDEAGRAHRERLYERARVQGRLAGRRPGK